jgi:glucosamine--fructose-6-phosphate aminotransferase (isomerizing)
VSQSGASPDIVALQDAAKRGGATTIAVVNVTDSPLAKQADIVLGLNAGAEKSVAATKSFIASVAALSGVTAAIGAKSDLQAALDKLPEALQATAGIDTAAAEDVLFNATSLYTGGRGPAFRDRSRGRAEGQGNLRPARRGLLAGRTHARPDAPRAARLPDRRLRAR